MKQIGSGKKGRTEVRLLGLILFSALINTSAASTDSEKWMWRVIAAANSGSPYETLGLKEGALLKDALGRFASLEGQFKKLQSKGHAHAEEALKIARQAFGEIQRKVLQPIYKIQLISGTPALSVNVKGFWVDFYVSQPEEVLSIRGHLREGQRGVDVKGRLVELMGSRNAEQLQKFLSREIKFLDPSVLERAHEIFTTDAEIKKRMAKTAEILLEANSKHGFEAAEAFLEAKKNRKKLSAPDFFPDDLDEDPKRQRGGIVRRNGETSKILAREAVGKELKVDCTLQSIPAAEELRREAMEVAPLVSQTKSEKADFRRALDREIQRYQANLQKGIPGLALNIFRFGFAQYVSQLVTSDRNAKTVTEENVHYENIIDVASFGAIAAGANLGAQALTMQSSKKIRWLVAHGLATPLAIQVHELGKEIMAAWRGETDFSTILERRSTPGYWGRLSLDLGIFVGAKALIRPTFLMGTRLLIQLRHLNQARRASAAVRACHPLLILEWVAEEVAAFIALETVKEYIAPVLDRWEVAQNAKAAHTNLLNLNGPPEDLVDKMQESFAEMEAFLTQPIYEVTGRQSEKEREIRTHYGEAIEWGLRRDFEQRNLIWKLATFQTPPEEETANLIRSLRARFYQKNRKKGPGEKATIQALAQPRTLGPLLAEAFSKRTLDEADAFWLERERVPIWERTKKELLLDPEEAAFFLAQHSDLSRPHRATAALMQIIRERLAVEHVWRRFELDPWKKDSDLESYQYRAFALDEVNEVKRQQRYVMEEELRPVAEKILGDPASLYPWEAQTTEYLSRKDKPLLPQTNFATVLDQVFGEVTDIPETVSELRIQKMFYPFLVLDYQAWHRARQGGRQIRRKYDPPALKNLPLMKALRKWNRDPQI